MKFLFHINFLLLIICGAGIDSFEQDIEIFHCMVSLSKNQEEIMKEYHIKPAALIDGRYIDPTASNQFDSVSFKTGIANFFRSFKDSGLGIIDWEGKSFDNLCFHPANSPSFQNSLETFRMVLDVAKRFRPNVKWGIYNFPYCSYWHRDNPEWRNQGAILKPLLEEMDILMLSLYDYYKDGAKFTDDKTYVMENTKMALEIASRLGKPLFVFVWQRYHESNPDIGLRLIPKKEFTRHIENLLYTKFDSLHISGLVWFDAQRYFYKTNPSIIKHDIKYLRTRESNLEEFSLKVYGNLLRSTVNDFEKYKQGY
jgi:hypothetical protein